MGNAQPGRHRVAKHAAPKKSRLSSRQTGVLFGLAGLSTVALTSSSAVVTASTEIAIPTASEQASASERKIITVSIRKAGLSRAQAASRSDDRQSLEVSALIVKAANLGNTTQQIDTTPTLTATERIALGAVAPTDDQLSTLVAQTIEDQASQAQRIIDVKAAKERARIAAAKAKTEKAKQDNSGSGGPVGTNGYSYSNSVSGLSRADIAKQVARLGKVVVPVKGGYKLSARFGERGYIWSNGWHTGMDFDVPNGTGVVASASGTILSAGWAGPYGYHIEIDHGDGYITTYSHLSRIYKSSGYVSTGEVLGLSGSTGNVTGAHLHFEVYKGDSFINPANWLWGN